MKAPAKADRSRAGGNKKLWILIGLLAVFLALAGGSFVYSVSRSHQNQQYDRIAADQLVLSQQIATAALQAAGGDAQGFKTLKSQRDRFGSLVNQLQNGDSAAGIEPLPSDMRPALNAMVQNWGNARKQIDKIENGQKTVDAIIQYVNQLDPYMPQLLAVSDNVTDRLIAAGASRHEIFLAGRQSFITQRMQNSLTSLLAMGQNASYAAYQLRQDTALFPKVLHGMLNGDKAANIAAVKDAQARTKLHAVVKVYAHVSGNFAAILKLSPKLLDINKAVNSLQGGSKNLLAASVGLEKAISANNAQLRTYDLAGYGFGGLALVSLILLGLVTFSDKKRELALTNEQNRRNQRAILRLLDEMTNLAEGDLTVHATVTEDITGAIADSVNYAIDALRSLVTTINQTSVQVATASEKTQTTALRLADASNHQAREIASASAAVTDMADSIERVAGNAMNSADVAKKSVEIAAKGTATVHRSIDGMNTIREQIQDTSKRIKRLGESSQEIGDIVGLINDIADQTNILALNAAIQASAAGEAGRGFAVVADEVQRLAERSANATRQIEALVKTIQADTSEAVLSMEQSTANVVAGGQLAEDAGEALTEIEGVSNQLAKQIMAIASSARQQAAVAANVTNTMNVIQEITMQTSDGTNETAQSIGQLTALAAELRKSVAGFKLPDSEDVATFVLEDSEGEDDEAAA